MNLSFSLISAHCTNLPHDKKKNLHVFINLYNFNFIYNVLNKEAYFMNMWLPVQFNEEHCNDLDWYAKPINGVASNHVVFTSPIGLHLYPTKFHTISSIFNLNAYYEPFFTNHPSNYTYMRKYFTFPKSTFIDILPMYDWKPQYECKEQS